MYNHQNNEQGSTNHSNSAVLCTPVQCNNLLTKIDSYTNIIDQIIESVIAINVLLNLFEAVATDCNTFPSSFEEVFNCMISSDLERMAMFTIDPRSSLQTAKEKNRGVRQCLITKFRVTREYPLCAFMYGAFRCHEEEVFFVLCFGNLHLLKRLKILLSIKRRSFLKKFDCGGFLVIGEDRLQDFANFCKDYHFPS